MLERISYMKGLAEGMEIDESSKEGKLLKEIILALEDISFEVELLQAQTDDMEDYIVAIDEDLHMIEEDFYEGSTLKSDCGDYENEDPVYLEELYLDEHPETI